MKNQNWISLRTDDLFKAVLKLKTLKESRNFFRDLLTLPEIKEFSNRWKAARMLDQKIPYSKIEKETGMSSTTIARINRWLSKGNGGYRLMIDRIKNNHHHDLSFSSERDS